MRKKFTLTNLYGGVIISFTTIQISFFIGRSPGKSILQNKGTERAYSVFMCGSGEEYCVNR